MKQKKSVFLQFAWQFFNLFLKKIIFISKNAFIQFILFFLLFSFFLKLFSIKKVEAPQGAWAPQKAWASATHEAWPQEALAWAEGVHDSTASSCC